MGEQVAQLCHRRSRRLQPRHEATAQHCGPRRLLRWSRSEHQPCPPLGGHSNRQGRPHRLELQAQRLETAPVRVTAFNGSICAVPLTIVPSFPPCGLRYSYDTQCVDAGSTMGISMDGMVRVALAKDVTSAKEVNAMAAYKRDPIGFVSYLMTIPVIAKWRLHRR